MFGHLSGWHLMIIAGIIFVIIAICAVVLIAVTVSRSSTPVPPPMPRGTAAEQHAPPPVRTTEQRLGELDDLRQRGIVSDAEYAQKREQILREL